jgi:group I intron endonuclease
MDINIYKLIDPNTNEVKYVGKTYRAIETRLKEHLDYRKGQKTKKINWIKSLVANDQLPIIEQIETCTDENWIEREQYWILYYRSIGNLTNMTDGGDGNHHQEFSRESIEKRSEKLRGQKRSPETRRKISDRLTGLIRSENNKKQISETLTRKYGKAILQFDLSDNFIAEYPSIRMAARETNTDRANLVRVVKGQYHHTNGFVFKLKNS